MTVWAAKGKPGKDRNEERGAMRALHTLARALELGALSGQHEVLANFAQGMKNVLARGPRGHRYTDYMRRDATGLSIEG
eukprot:12715-Eustigmatos_ZCMA.PRE.1